MKYNEERVSAVVNGIKELKGRVGACKEAGINYQTFLDWMDGKMPKKLLKGLSGEAREQMKGEFSERIKKAEYEAEERGKNIAIQSVFQGMKTSWQAGAWWLERKYNNEYARRDISEHAGKVDLNWEKIAKNVRKRISKTN